MDETALAGAAAADIALEKGGRLFPRAEAAAVAEGSSGGIPGRVAADPAAFPAAESFPSFPSPPPGVTALAASLTIPNTPPKSPPAAWPTWLTVPLICWT